MTKVLRAGQFKADEAGESPRWEDDALGFLIAPVDREDFLENYYEQKPLINIRGEPDRYARPADARHRSIISSPRGPARGHGRPHQPSQPDRRATTYVDEDGRISRVAVAEEYLNGATIILPQLHNSMFNLGEFCRSLEEVFSCHIQTNIYLTPQVNAEGTANQGFPPHYDNHDVFVMQISGSKAWRVYGTPVETPFRGERFELGRHERGRGDAGVHAERRRLRLSAARPDARRRECRRRAVAAHHRRPDHQDLGGSVARIDLRAGAELARFPPLAAGRLCAARFRPRDGARAFRQADQA